MRITKFEHACLVLELQSNHLIIDPGDKITAAALPSTVSAVVITHEHDDHYTVDNIASILEHSHKAEIYAPVTVATILSNHFPQAIIHPVINNFSAKAGPFTLEFYCGDHAIIHSSVPIIKNNGVLVNNRFFYGGDSLEIPETLPRNLELVAIASGAPWHRIADAIDYTVALHPQEVFLTHDMSNSDWGNQMSAARISTAIESVGGKFNPLKLGETVILPPDLDE